MRKWIRAILCSVLLLLYVQPVYADESPESIKKFISQQKGEFAYYYQNLNTGESFAYNENKVFRAASTTKLPLALYVYQLAEERQIDLSEKLTYRSYHYYGGTGIIQYDRVGSRYTIRDLVRIMLIHSDNIAFIMLQERVGHDHFTSFLKSLGAKNVYLNGVNTASAKDLALYARSLYDFTRHHVSGSELLDWLEHTDFNETIPVSLSDVKVAHKVGFIPTELVFNDTAIIFDHTPYVIAIMTKSIPYEQETKTIAQLDYLIYLEHQKMNAPLKSRTEEITLNKITNLYQDPSFISPVLGALGPQSVLSINEIPVDGGWYHIDTWRGDAWINGEDANIHEIPMNPQPITLLMITDLYDSPFSHVHYASLLPQTVTAVQKWNNWYRIQTWIGDKWIKVD